MVSQKISKFIQLYGCEPVQFFGTDNALYERHLVFDNIVDRSGFHSM
jgi:glycogen phosphorylase